MRSRAARRVTFSSTLLAVFAASSHADCIDDAAAHHGVNSHVLRAIGWHESRLKPEAVGKNTNGTVDLGAFQINSMHLPLLQQYGVDRGALMDGCTSAYVGAWHYKRQIQQLGNTWAAVGAYHSRTPARTAWYANQIASIMMKWGVLPKGPLPYSGVPLLAPNQSMASARKPQAAPSQQVAATTVFDVGTNATQTK